MTKINKIAAVTDDGETISQHFGRATKYTILTMEGDQVTQRELRDKPGHHTFHQQERHGEHEHDPRGRGFGTHSADKHQKMFETISDCDMILARGMGRGAYLGAQQFNIRPIVTDIPMIEAAVQPAIDGENIYHTEKLH